MAIAEAPAEGSQRSRSLRGRGQSHSCHGMPHALPFPELVVLFHLSRIEHRGPLEVTAWAFRRFPTGVVLPGIGYCFVALQ